MVSILTSVAVHTVTGHELRLPSRPILERLSRETDESFVSLSGRSTEGVDSRSAGEGADHLTMRLIEPAARRAMPGRRGGLGLHATRSGPVRRRGVDHDLSLRDQAGPNYQRSWPMAAARQRKVLPR